MNKVITHGRSLIEQKALLVINLKDELRRTTEHFSKLNELSTIGQREAEIAFKERLFVVQSEFAETKKNISDQYEHIIEQKDEQMRKFMIEIEKYMVDKK